jgi:phosphoribosylaminoimidazole-succinocarboxamide synthase
MINTYHIKALGIATEAELKTLAEMSFKINEILKDYLINDGIILVDFKLEFGKTSTGEIVLADEISPDTCRFWDSVTKEKLDKDRFRRNLGGEVAAYEESSQRVLGE